MDELKLKENNEINWELILSSCDTIKYITKSEMIELSQTCCSIRNMLLTHLFKNITLNNISNILDDPGELPPYELYPTEYQSSISDRYKERLSSLIPRVKSLVSEDEYNESLLLSIPQVFYGLNSLQLTDTTITLATLHKLMSDLGQLEHLNLIHPTIIALGASNTSINLILPPSLNTFKIAYGELIRAEFIPGFRLGDYLDSSNQYNTDILKFNIKRGSLPKLRVLDIAQDDQDFIETQNSLLFASDKLTHLITRYSLIDEQSAIKLQSLKSLTLFNNYQVSQNFTEFEFFGIKKLKELNIIGELGLLKHDGSITLRFKKLINLGKYVEKLTLPFIRSFKYSIENILQNFENLKELGFINTGILVSLNSDTFPKTIKTLNLYNVHPKLIDIKNIKYCPRLEAISINYKNQSFNNSEFEDSEFSKVVKGWKVIHFPGVSIKCYKDKNQQSVPKQLYASVRNLVKNNIDFVMN